MSECIRHSDGGVSEHTLVTGDGGFSVYQAFRWWGVGTVKLLDENWQPVYQAFRWWGVGTDLGVCIAVVLVYQAFRWWGVGTDSPFSP